MTALALASGSFFDRWVNDPVAVTTLMIAVVGGAFAYYRFRFVPRERQRETLDAMQKAYALSLENRKLVLRGFPAFVVIARDRLLDVVREAQPKRSDLLDELQAWPAPADMAAHEILASEAKLRTLLLAIREVASFQEVATQDEVDLLQAAVELVAQLNDFAQLVELNLFSQSDVLGQFHRSIAPACKAVEPLIWARSLRGRWGLRVLRLLIRAEQFNDTKAIHRSSSLVWSRSPQAGEPRRVVVREALYRDDYGKPKETERLAQMGYGQRLGLRAAALWVRIRGKYGGTRLARHMAAENRLVGRLRFATDARLDPMDLSWRLADLEQELQRRWGTPIVDSAVDRV